jgi:hypothetical protein
LGGGGDERPDAEEEVEEECCAGWICQLSFFRRGREGKGLVDGEAMIGRKGNGLKEKRAYAMITVMAKVPLAIRQ